jgi:predicted nucleic acid-binding protein
LRLKRSVSEMLDTLTFDAEPILSFFLDDLGAKKVADLLQRVQNKDALGYINIFNLTEIYYVTSRINIKIAEDKQRKLRLFGLKVIPVIDNGLWREAAIIKSKYSISLGDAFAIATAQSLNSKLVVGYDKGLKNYPVPILRIHE